MHRRVVRWVVGVLVLAVANIAVPSASAQSTSDSFYAGGATAPGATGPGLTFFLDEGAHKIHDLSGTTHASYSCTLDLNTYSGNRTSFKIAGPIRVSSDRKFSYHGLPSDGGNGTGTLDLSGRFTADRSKAVGTYHVAGSLPVGGGPVPGFFCPYETSGSFVVRRSGVVAKNHRPVAHADRVPAKRSTAPVKVLGNDADADHDPLSVRRVEKLKCGRLKVAANRKTIAFVAPSAGCAKAQRGVYVATDGKADSNRASFFTPVVRPAKRSTQSTSGVAVQIHALKGNVRVGAHLRFSIEVKNLGRTPAKGVQLTIAWPRDGLGNSTDLDVGPRVCSSIYCDIGTLGSGKSAVIHITFEAVDALFASLDVSKSVQTATVTAAVSSTTADPNLQDNRATHTNKIIPKVQLICNSDGGDCHQVFNTYETSLIATELSIPENEFRKKWCSSPVGSEGIEDKIIEAVLLVVQACETWSEATYRSFVALFQRRLLDASSSGSCFTISANSDGSLRKRGFLGGKKAAGSKGCPHLAL